jgi:CDP-paratose 2-epimerase
LEKEIKHKNYNWNFLKKFKKIKHFKQDIRDFKFLKNFMKNNQVDIIFHTAGQTAVTTSIKDPYMDFRNNVVGTMNVLEAVRLSENDPLMIFTSTNKVYGNNVNKRQIEEKEKRFEFNKDFKDGIPEDYPVDLSEHTPYGTSKLCADQYFQEYGTLYGLKTGIFRMSCIYGERQFGVEEQGWISHFIYSALKNEVLNIFGNGKQVRDILYISDLIQVFKSFIGRFSKSNKNVFCIGGGPQNTISILELVEMLEVLLDKEIKIKFKEWRPKDQKVYISDITKATKLLNWKPKIKPITGVEKVVKWMRNNQKILGI